MFIFDRWVLGRSVRKDLKNVRKKNTILDARISILEQSRQIAQVSTSDDGIAPLSKAEKLEEVFFASKGSGYSTAKLIMLASTLEKAKAIYDTYRAARYRDDKASANWAYLYRLDEAGHGDEVNSWAFNLAGEDEEIFLHKKVQNELMRWRKGALANGA